MKWEKISDFDRKSCGMERWIYKDSNVEKSFNVEINYGKKTDILALKQRVISEFKSEVEDIKKTRSNIFQGELEEVNRCPICNSTTGEAREVLNIYNASYHQCENCKHCFVAKRPSKKSLDEFYSKSKDYQSDYTDEVTLQTRINQVAIPKAEYVINKYEKIYGKKPKSILDIGAGSGHFVYACRKLGIKSDGIEISQPGRKFCKDNFDIDLYDKDFIEYYDEFKNYDIITFWGVIEHLPYPLQMLDAANKALAGRETLLVVDVPRWQSFSTAIQSLTPNTIVRHLDPLGHINFFTDMSLATAYVKCNFDIVSAWYFGMDMYEFIIQSAYMANNDGYVEGVKKLIQPLQEILDYSKLSDEIVLIGVPSKNK